MSDTFSPTQTQTVPLTKSQCGALRDALEHYYGDSLGLAGSVNVDGPWTDINGIFRWKDRQDFNEKIFDKLQIPVQAINEKFANSLYLELTKREINAPRAVEFKEAEASPVSATTLDRDQQTLLNEKLKKVEDEKAKSDAEQIRKVRESIEQQKAQAELNKEKSVSQQTPNQPINQPADESLVKDFFAKTNKQVVVGQETPKEEVSIVTPLVEENFQPTAPYIVSAPQTPESENKVEAVKTAIQLEADSTKQSTQEEIKRMRDSLEKRNQTYIQEQKEIEELQTELAENKAKVYMRVTVTQDEPTPQAKILEEQAKLSPNSLVNDVTDFAKKSPLLDKLPENERELIAKNIAITTYQNLAGSTDSYVSTDTSFEQAVAIYQVVSSPNLINQLTQDASDQAKIKKAALNMTDSKFGQYEMWRQMMKLTKLGTPTKTEDVRVEFSQTPHPGYTEVTLSTFINNEVLEPHRQSLENQMSTIEDIGRDLGDRGISNIRSRIFEGASKKITDQIAKLPADSALSKFYNHAAVQAAMADMGVIPSSWTAVEGNWLGNYFTSSGYSNFAGYMQRVTGIDLGMIEIGSLGAGYSLAGGFEYYTTSALAIEYSGGMFAGEAFMGGAGVALAPEAIATAAAETGFESIAGFGAYSAPTIATAATAGLESATVATAAATAGGETLVGVGAGAVAGQAAIPIPFIGLAIGAMVALGKKLYSLINSPKIKELLSKAGGYILGGGVVAALMGYTLLATPLLVGGGAIVFANGVTLAGITTGIGNFLKAAGGFLLFTIGVPFIIGLSCFVLLVIFCIFIINNSAYVTPQGADLTGLGYAPDGSVIGGVPGSATETSVQNPYIGVVKTVSPAGPFQNGDPQLSTVTWTITITAKQQTLTNVNVKDVCTITSKNGSFQCPSTSTQPPDNTISVGVPFTYSFTDNYQDSRTNDSLITNKVDVTANVLSQTATQTTSAAASITIGKPPAGCLVLDDSWKNGTYKANLQQAINTLAGSYNSYVSKVCSSFSKISLTYYPGGNANYFGMNGLQTSGIATIRFYPLGVGTYGDALYTLAHELGHSLASGSKTAYIYSAYKSFQSGGKLITSESPYCFYLATQHWNPDESMPESIALNVLSRTGVKGLIFASNGCSGAPTKWPVHYNFLQQFVFN